MLRQNVDEVAKVLRLLERRMGRLEAQLRAARVGGFISVVEFAAALNMHEKNLFKLEKQDRENFPPGFRRGGRRLWTETEVREYLKWHRSVLTENQKVG